ncbi:hypothetical protein LCGC14_0235160 [marine sediment metagenome]|uniref:Uncharacterized protein n=1 Tax=marine sediment metagenome TaxID=412755 RepID=A0A0F9U8W2_9ZZZZ
MDWFCVRPAINFLGNEVHIEALYRLQNGYEISGWNNIDGYRCIGRIKTANTITSRRIMS